ncbi:5766_t:CDS:2, partial [Acaulospora colombiana]
MGYPKLLQGARALEIGYRDWVRGLGSGLLTQLALSIESTNALDSLFNCAHIVMGQALANTISSCPMDNSKKATPGIHQTLALTSNAPFAVAHPDLSSSITSLKAIKEAAEGIPQVGRSIEATSDAMILVLETIRKCKGNRDGWRELAEIIQEKNQRVISLLRLYSEAPDKYNDVLEQANKYQNDMKKEIETELEKGSGLQGYWERMKTRGRETILSEINAKKIVGYRERLRDLALSTTEAVGQQMIGKLNKIEKRWEEQVLEKFSWSHKMALKPRPPLVAGFVGRDDILEVMRSTHFGSAPASQTTPRVTVLTGLGGSGKTQIALKFASEFEQKCIHPNNTRNRLEDTRTIPIPYRYRCTHLASKNKAGLARHHGQCGRSFTRL